MNNAEIQDLFVGRCQAEKVLVPECYECFYVCGKLQQFHF